MPPTLEGVLGDYPAIHPEDVKTSLEMLKKFANRISGFNVAIDCGSGWGRITESVLLKRFKQVDMLDPSKTQLNKARKRFQGRVRNFYQIGLQQFDLKTKYDCIWVQGVLMYLTDDDCLDFLKKARDCLVQLENGNQGLMFIKENIADDKFTIDKNDNSIMRT